MRSSDHPAGAAPAVESALEATARGRELARAGRLDEALAAFLGAAERDAGILDAHLGIYEVAQILRRPELALAHQAAAIALAPVQSTPASLHEDYALLVPCVAGPYTANTPADLLFDPARVTLHRWYVDPAGVFAVYGPASLHEDYALLVPCVAGVDWTGASAIAAAWCASASSGRRKIWATSYIPRCASRIPASRSAAPRNAASASSSRPARANSRPRAVASSADSTAGAAPAG